MPGAASPPSEPTSAGRSMTPTGCSPMARRSRSSTSKTTTAATASPPRRCSRLHRCRHAGRSRRRSRLAGLAGTVLVRQRHSLQATLATALAPIGVIASHSRPYHPQGNGKIERFHQTLQKWLAKQPRAATIDRAASTSSTGSGTTTTRNALTAPSADASPPTCGPAPQGRTITRPLGTPTTVHDSLVRHGSCHAGRRYHISVGAAHNGKRALTFITGTACHVFIDGHLARQLTLNPDHTIPTPLHPNRTTTYHREGRPATCVSDVSHRTGH